MSWGRRLILLVVAAMGATFLAMALSAALARPASAATLPVPAVPGLPVRDIPAAPADSVTGTPTSLGGVVPTESLGPLSGQLPIEHLPIPEVPFSISTVTAALTTGVAPAVTTTDAPAPCIG